MHNTHTHKARNSTHIHTQHTYTHIHTPLLGRASRFGEGASNSNSSPGPQYYTPLKGKTGVAMGKTSRFHNPYANPLQTPGPKLDQPSMVDRHMKAGKFDKQNRWTWESATVAQEKGAAKQPAAKKY